MFCIVAFVILAIVGIFSASYRDLAREALSCVLRRVTLRPCDTGFDVKMKSRILGSVINRSETAARLLNRNFEILSWALFVLMIGSTFYAARGLYLYYVTGSCSGLNETSFCLLDPKGENSKMSALSSSCQLTPTTVADLNVSDVNLTLFPTVKGKGRAKVVMIGCYGCDYTRKVYRDLKQLATTSGAEFVFIDFPVKVKTQLMAKLGLCAYQLDAAKYWKLNELLFKADAAKLDDPAMAQKLTLQAGLNWNEVDRCLKDPATQDAVDRQMDEVAKTNFFGTPTVFIGNKAFVGPKPLRVYAIAMDGLFYWAKMTSNHELPAPRSPAPAESLAMAR
jgi:protein-disulfide isomerase